MPDNEPPPPRTQLRVPDPEPFNWVAEEWPAWSRRYERFCRLSGLDKDDATRQVDFLIYLMGDKAEEVMKTFKYVPPETAASAQTLLKKFTEHFGGKINVVYERAKFNQRYQQPGEPAIDFITDLFGMAEKCNYRDLKEELIRDRIIVGISNIQLSAAMQMDAAIDLNKAKETVLQAEDVQKQLPTVRNGHGDTAQAQVHAAFQNKGKGKKPGKPVTNNKPVKPQQDGKKAQYPNSCKRCGRSPSHPISQCPAKNGICGKCKAKGHWAVMCRTKISEATATENENPQANEVSYYLDCVEAAETFTKPSKILRVDITSNGQLTRWKIDSGADVPIVGDKHVDILQPTDVVPAGIKIFLAGSTPADITGKFKVKVDWKGKAFHDWVYILPGQKEPLLSRDLALKLGLITLAPEVLSVSQVAIKPEEQYPEVFEGLGRMGEDINHVPGKSMHAADTLSRMPSEKNTGEPDVISEVRILEIEVPMSPVIWKAVKEAQEKDSTSKLLRDAVLEGWPGNPKELPQELKPFHEHRGMLNVLQGVLMYAKRVYIPDEMRSSILTKLHQGHLGTPKCRGRAQDTVWWPGITEQVADFVSKCLVCKINRKNNPEPLLNAPMEEGLSPSQLLMGRSLRTTLPQLEGKLVPNWSYLEDFRKKRQEKQAKQQANFNARHKARPLPELSKGERVWISDYKSFASVSGQADTPRSYWVQTSQGAMLRRNRKELIPVSPDESEQQQLGIFQYLSILQDSLVPEDSTEDRGPPPSRTPTPTPTRPPPSSKSKPKDKEPKKGKGRGRTSLSPTRPGGSAAGSGQHTRTREIKPPVRYQDASWGGIGHW
ncbi:hypothetical protein KUF71_013813 [Frankliniella fusca]|uniref:RNA-directed DNA polymerase n=1 Tax=Frankliniella fusca TaxID=407009 RepID=A0AAE1LNZ2_9NEOP|nr:hypothetical protein KUF71_013813 [Frankliniella fusca]